MPCHLTRSDYEGERDLFRQSALEALDEAAKDFAVRRFRREPSAKIEGARDPLLPALFRAADVCFDDMLTRYGFTWDA